MRHILRPSLGALGLLLALLVPSLVFIQTAHTAPDAAPDGASRVAREPEPGAAAARVKENYGLLPLSFEANRGQTDARVRFLARNGAASIYLTADEIALALRGTNTSEAPESRASVLRIKLLGASKRSRAYGLEELEGKSNYLLGRDPSRWRTNVPHYGRVKYEGVYPGVDVVYYGTQRQLEYDFVLAPGADAARIRLGIEGAKGISLDANGDLVLPTAAGEVRQRAPYAYQEVAGVKRTVACRYVLRDGSRVGFELGAYDRALPLVIDPLVGYATYLGGGGYDEGSAIAVDAQGNAYVTGFTTSWDFPVTPNAVQQERAGGAPHRNVYDAFVTKLNADGTALLYSTYLGGFEDDFSTSLAVDSQGRAHIAGFTASADFPTSGGAHSMTSAGGQDVFVSQLSPDGAALLYSTYLGGSGNEYGARLALGGDGEVYVGGMTPSNDFPVTPGAFQPEPGGPAGVQDGFVTKLSTTAYGGLFFSTYLGGASPDFVEGVAVSSLDGSVYVTGRTVSGNFPTTPNALQPNLASGGGSYDAFVTRLNSAGTAAVFSTYLGGSDYDGANGIAVGPDGTAYVVGSTHSQNFPTTQNAYRMFGNNSADGFVAKLSDDGAGLAYSTYLGGTADDRANAVAVDAQGEACVVGDTSSPDFPVTPDAPRTVLVGGSYDGFLFKLNAMGNMVTYGTYVGGSDSDGAKGVAVGAGGNVYLTGNTSSSDFSTTPGAFQPQDPDTATSDAYLMRFVLGAASYSVSGRVTNFHGNPLRDAVVTVYSPVYQTATTDADGHYTINGLPAGAEVRLYATRFGAPLVPIDAVLPYLSRDETVDFTGSVPLVISGRVRTEFGYGFYGPVTLSGTVSDTVYTDYDGNYSFIVPEGGSYTVMPGPDSFFAFDPPLRTASYLTGDHTMDFTAQQPPRIAGRVVHDGYDYGIGDIKVTLTGPSLQQPLVQTTDQWGYFSFDQLERGATYTVTPSDPNSNRSFSPAEQTVEQLQGQQPFLTFRALQPLALHGRVTDPEGNPVTGVAELSGTVNATTEIDQWGYYSFFDLPRGGDYTVTITKPGSLYTFTPPSRSVTNLQQFTSLDFTALPPLRILGRVADLSSNTGLPATVELSGTVNATTQADQWGFYRFEQLPRGGTYTVTPTYPLYTFTPESSTVTDLQQHQNFDFEALPPLRIMGTLSDGSAGIANATVELNGTVNATAVTDASGSYIFNELPRGGTYTVTPEHDLYDFTPPSTQLPSMSSNKAVHFQGALRRFTLSGRATDAEGVALANVTVTLGGTSAATTQTDAAGNYSFANLVFTRPYTVAASRPGFTFAPATVNITDPRADQSVSFNATRLTYTIGGRITDKDDGSPVAGATMTLSGGRSATTETDADGRYSFAGLPSEGDYTVHVSHPHYRYGFPTYTHFNLLYDLTNLDWSGTRLLYDVTGRVLDAAGNMQPGVTVTLSGGRNATTTTDAQGTYIFPFLPAGLNYTVTAAKTHYTLSPPSHQLDNLSADKTANFTATLLTHNITGRVLDASGNGFAGATVSLTGWRNATVTTGADGAFSFNALSSGGSYTVTASRTFYDFSPFSANFNDLSADRSVSFTATLRTYNLSGRVAEGANGVAGATVTLSGSRNATAQTDASGNYLFTQLPADGTYTVTPAHPFFSFAPAGKTFNTLPSNQTADFAAARLLYQISGAIVDACGRAIPGVNLSLTRDGATAVTTQANSSGLYSFNNVQAGYNYTLVPSGAFYTYSPASTVINALGGNRTVNFTGTPPTTTVEVVTTADLFVRGGTSAGTNYGTNTQLFTRLASNVKDTFETYVKFDAGQRCTVSSVKLRLYGQLNSISTMTVGAYAVSSTMWTETGTNWNNKPGAGALLSTATLTGTTLRWYEWDVTDYVRAELNAGRTVVSFVLKSTNTTNYQATFNSRQASSNGPRLAITTP